MRFKFLAYAAVCAAALLAFGHSICLAEDGPTDKKVAWDKIAKRQEFTQGAGWVSVDYLLPRLKKMSKEKHPGIAAWAADLDRVAGKATAMDPESWPENFDFEALTLHNPNYWRATLEIAPGDVMWQSNHQSLLLCGGEYERAFYVGVILLHGDNIPPSMKVTALQRMAFAQQANELPQRFVDEAVELYDAGKLDEALKILKVVVKQCPTHPHAWYEYGYTLRAKEIESDPSARDQPLTMKYSRDGKFEGELPTHFTPKIEQAYARCRKHDPLFHSAYFAPDKELLERLHKVNVIVRPLWDRLLEDGPEGHADDAVLKELSVALRDAELYELAMITRQTLIGRHGAYDAEDGEFVATCLRALAPGEATEEAIASLENRTEFFKMAR